jgi:hypothetical protein
MDTSSSNQNQAEAVADACDEQRQGPSTTSKDADSKTIFTGAVNNGKTSACGNGDSNVQKVAQDSAYGREQGKRHVCRKRPRAAAMDLFQELILLPF